MRPYSSCSPLEAYQEKYHSKEIKCYACEDGFVLGNGVCYCCTTSEEVLENGVKKRQLVYVWMPFCSHRCYLRHVQVEGSG